jgi:trk system potassium uptake protein TrkH
MFLSGLNFSLHFLILTGLRRFFDVGPMRALSDMARKIKQDEECAVYIKIVFAAFVAVFVSLCISSVTRSWGVSQTVRASFFQVVSIASTAGFIAEHNAVWPPFAEVLMVILMFTGACAGSTGGGIKVLRAIGVTRLLRAEIAALLHPRAVLLAHRGERTQNGRVLSGAALSSMAVFFVAYILVFFSGSLLVSAFGVDIGTAFSVVISSISNIAAGFMPPGDNYARLPGGVKWISCFFMLAGRLEFYPALLLLSPATWKR